MNSCGPSSGPSSYVHWGMSVLCQKEDAEGQGEAQPGGNCCCRKGHRLGGSREAVYYPTALEAGSQDRLLLPHSGLRNTEPGAAGWVCLRMLEEALPRTGGSLLCWVGAPPRAVGGGHLQFSGHLCPPTQDPASQSQQSHLRSFSPGALVTSCLADLCFHGEPRLSSGRGIRLSP